MFTRFVLGRPTVANEATKASDQLTVAFAVVLICSLSACSRSPASGGLPAQTPAARDHAGDTVSNAIAPDLAVGIHYCFDHNAIVGSELVGESLVALTRTGDLLRFDVGALLLQQERQCVPGYVCIGRSDSGAIIAACADGTLEEIDAVSLKGHAVAKLPGRPRWVCADRAGKTIIAILTRDQSVENWPRPMRMTSRAWDVKAKSGFDLQEDSMGGASAFMVDDNRRLIMGADHGEWGGWCRCLDLRTGQQVDPETGQAHFGLSGVYGFARLPGGAALVYGGMHHFSGHASALRLTSDNQLQTLFDGWATPPPGHNAAEPPKAPEMPITHVAVDPQNGQLVVFSYSDIFISDPEMKSWRWIARPDLRYTPGRPDAMSAYPAVSSVHVRPGGRIIFTTQGDGVMELLGAKVIAHTLERVPTFDARICYGATAEGLVVGGPAGISDRELFLVQSDSVHQLALDPPIAPPTGRDWRTVNPVHIGKAASTYCFSAYGEQEQSCLVTWQDQKPTIIYHGPRIDGSSVFQTTDGKWWEAHGKECLRQLVNGQWRQMCPMPFYGGDVRKVVTHANPWYVLNSSSLLLLRDDPPASCSIAQVQLKSPDGEIKQVFDALEREDGILLLATDKGTFEYDPRQSDVKAFPSVPSSVGIRHLCVDREGIIWLAGNGLWLVNPKSRKLQQVTELPSLATSGIENMATGPDGRAVVILENGAFMTLTAR